MYSQAAAYYQTCSRNNWGPHLNRTQWIARLHTVLNDTHTLIEGITESIRLYFHYKHIYICLMILGGHLHHQIHTHGWVVGDTCTTTCTGWVVGDYMYRVGGGGHLHHYMYRVGGGGHLHHYMYRVGVGDTCTTTCTGWVVVGTYSIPESLD